VSTTDKTGAGFAAAAAPVAGSSVVHTDSAGLVAGAVAIAVGGFAMPAYRAKPAGGSNLPVILVLSEIFGVHEHIADVARRFAKLGYLAIAPELFVRQGDAKTQPDVATLVRDVVDKVPDAQVMADLDATVAWVGEHGGDVSRLGVTGFCWGGRITWLYAAHQAKVKAGVAWYGKLKLPPTPAKPRHPVDVAGELHASVLGLYGGQDQSIPMESVEQMKSALAHGGAAGKASEFVVYPDAGHAFHADYRPSYNAEDARDGWQRCVAWFASHGVQPGVGSIKAADAG
jgi:carboxymethylenebutenolidase